jgi:hypothetical protein
VFLKPTSTYTGPLDPHVSVGGYEIKCYGKYQRPASDSILNAYKNN